MVSGIARDGIDQVAPNRQEKGKRFSAPCDVNSLSDNEFARATTRSWWRRKGKKKATCVFEVVGGGGK
jgi:hypothetical protein